MRRRATLAVLLALLAVTAGCGGAANDGGEPQAGGDGGNAATQAADGSSGGSSAGGSDADTGSPSVAAMQSDRALIRTGTVRLEVGNFDAAQRNITEAVRARGGYVSDTSRRTNGHENATWTAGTVVLRIPSENFSGLVDAVGGEGEMLASETSTEDVTDRVVDLRARLGNLRAERDRLRELYQEANDTESVLAVEERLSEVQGEIERAEANLRSLENRVAYSTLTVELREPRPETTDVDRTAWYDTGPVDAFLQSVEGVGVTLRALLVAAAYVAPYALAFGVPVVVALLLARRLGHVRGPFGR